MEFITSIDFAILDFIQSAIKNFILDPVMMVFSYAGDKGAIWIILGLVLLFFRKTRVTGVMVLAALLLGLVMGEYGLKFIACRPRPFVTNTDITLNIVAPSGYSFPSGHSIAAFSSALIVAVRERRAFGIAAYVVAALIAFSRLYNYVHFPTDVLAGMAIGTIAALIVIFVFKKTKLDNKIENIGKKKNAA